MIRIEDIKKTKEEQRTGIELMYNGSYRMSLSLFLRTPTIDEKNVWHPSDFIFRLDENMPDIPEEKMRKDFKVIGFIVKEMGGKTETVHISVYDDRR